MSIVFKNKKEILDRYITSSMKVLDVGFWGQGTTLTDADWPHQYLIDRADEVFGIDIVFDRQALAERFGEEYTEKHFVQASAEDFSFEEKFDVIYAGDLIEHLSNPGLFLQACRNHLNPGGFIVVNTPNCYNLFNMAGKLSRREPVVNHDHTCYFNEKTMKQLCGKNNLQIEDTHFIYSLPIRYRRSVKKVFLDGLYFILSLFTTKYMENMVFIIKPIIS